MDLAVAATTLDMDDRVRRRVLDGIVEQIEQQLQQQITLPRHRQRP